MMETNSLSTTESDRLAICCGKVEVCCDAFYDAGLALIEIRDSKLYREVANTFAEFCEMRFGFGDRYARYYMRAAETMKNLSSTCQYLPPNERVCRSLNLLSEDSERERLWKRLSEKAAKSGSVVSSNVVEKAVQELLNPNGKPKKKKKTTVVDKPPIEAIDVTPEPPTENPNGGGGGELEELEQASAPDPDAQPDAEELPDDQMKLAAQATHEVLHAVFPKVLGYSLRIDRFLRAVGKEGIDTDLIDDCMKQVHAQLELAERRCRS